jgi:hypothetical protein
LGSILVTYPTTNPVLTALALNEAELNSRTLTLLVVPKARLPIILLDRAIIVKGGIRMAQILLSTHSSLTTMSEVEPKSMLDVKSRGGGVVEGNYSVNRHVREQVGIQERIEDGEREGNAEKDCPYPGHFLSTSASLMEYHRTRRAGMPYFLFELRTVPLYLRRTPLLRH